MYVLDTSALIEAFNESPVLAKLHALVNDEPLATTSICMHEVLVGARSEKDFFVLEHLFSTMRILDFSAYIAPVSARIVHDLTKTGTMIGRLDVLIAATCKYHNAHLITLDADFSKIKGLNVTLIK